MASKAGYDADLTEELFRGDEEALEKDRALISQFMTSAKVVLDELNEIERNNKDMKRTYHKQVHENKRADGESKSTKTNNYSQNGGHECFDRKQRKATENSQELPKSHEERH